MMTPPLPRTAAPALVAALFFFLAAIPEARPAERVLSPFSSDGCSLFPDGTPGDRSNWCGCCFAHDMAYWRGGTEEERLAADEALRDCVLQRTGDKTLAETMYIGVRAGGHPVFPTWYRWAYGWSYGRGYQPLTAKERALVEKRKEEYSRDHPGGYCRPH